MDGNMVENMENNQENPNQKDKQADPANQENREFQAKNTATNPEKSVVVYIGRGGLREQAEAFARRNSFPLSDSLGDFLTVVFDSRGVSLSGFGLEYRGDFSEMLHRVSDGRLAHEMLVRASKTDKPCPVAVDATAGMGEDAFLLASYGYDVTLCEQNPVIALLLSDALRRAGRNALLRDTVGRMHLYRGDSIAYLSALQVPPDLVYLDPMFPARQKSGLINKKLQLIQKLESPCSEEKALFGSALSANPSKIVVKRPLKAPCLAGVSPTYSLDGKAIRYDCYVRRKDE